jgi:peptidoglycan hydrolase-like protein with peptidoglycan-binding domain
MTSRSGMNEPLRVFILTFSVLAMLVGAEVANAGPSTTVRDQLASVDPAILGDASQETEDLIGLDKAKRRHLQRGLTRLGFDTKANGRFDEPTRAVIARWQAARGYPGTGFLNTEQHTALRAEIASVAQASGKTDDTTPRRGGGSARHHPGGPGALIGGVVGGMFR